MDHGTERIDDARELHAVRRQARRVMVKSVATAVVGAAAYLLGTGGRRPG